jgi:hypothetical protein
MARVRDHWGVVPQWRPSVAAATVACHLLATVGFPLPGAEAVGSKDRSRPFPCQDRPCGCRTYEECWAGDCCCFTLREKVAWARSHAVEPPDHAVRATDGRTADCCSAEVPTEPCPHCQPSASTVAEKPLRWVVGVLAQRCKGHPQTAASVSAVGVTPPLAIAFVTDMVCVGYVSVSDQSVATVPTEPLIPPPRD